MVEGLGNQREPIELDGGHAFRMGSVHDVFRKLKREKSRFANAGASRQDQIDAAINFAITAWHISDWVWKQHADAFRGVLGTDTLKEFHQYLRGNSRELAACDVIANAVKHGGLAFQRKDRPDIDTVLVAEPVHGDPEAPIEVQVVAMMNRGWSLKVRIDGRSEHMGVVLERTYGFWHRFIQQWCVPLGSIEIQDSVFG